MPQPSRLAGVDAARGLAVIGMIWAHTAADGPAESLADGRSSVLFATLAGVSLGLITGGAAPVTGRARRDRTVSVALRGLVLIGLGLGLWLVGAPIWVILDYYGVLFLVLLPVLFAPLPVIGAVGLVALLAGPFLIEAIGKDERTPFTSGRLAQLPAEWFVTGDYPGVLWAAYLCAGLIAARLDLGRRRTLVALLVAGSASSLLGYGGARLAGLDATAHSNTTAEALGAGGLALAVIAGLQLLTASGVVRRVLTPITAAGSMPLTIYTAQILLIAVWVRSPLAGEPRSIQSWVLLVGLVLGALVFASLWRWRLGRGPLEDLMAQLTTVRSEEAPARPVR